MTDEVVVPFAGAEEGVGGLTWAQRGLWRAMEVTGTSLPLGGLTPLPPGTTVESIADGLGHLFGRHPSLRTRLRLRPGEPEQVVAGSGKVGLAVVDADGADPGAVADALLAEWDRTPFDYEAEWPTRWAVVRSGGTPTHMVAVYCHLALDLQGLEVLLADLGLRGPVDRRDAVSPLELARQQAEPAALRQSAASLRHWDAVLRRVPARRFGGAPDPVTPRWREFSYSSVAALHAARLLAARAGVVTGPVLLAACASALTRVTGVRPSVLQLLVNNRFRPGFARAVTPLSQSALALVETGGGFADVVESARRAVVQSAKNAYYDPYALDEVYAHADLDRGEEVDVDAFFNDRRRQAGHDDPVPLPTPADVRAAAPHSRPVGERGLELFDHRLFVHVDDVRDTVQWTVCGDSHHLAPADLAALPVRMEEALVAAALALDS